MSLWHEHTSDPVLVGHRGLCCVCRAMVLGVELVGQGKSVPCFSHQAPLTLRG